jgi:transcriptional regulator GlxA family with amidase domain
VRIAIILFDGFDELDAIGPYEVFRHAAKLGADIDVELLTLSDVEEVTASGGLRVRPHGCLQEAPDMAVVPGGGWNDRASQGAWTEVQRGQLTQVLRELHDGGTAIATVCTGGMVAAAAGLTNKRPGTTHHAALEELRASGAHVIDARVVDDGDLTMAGGVTSGIDLALWLVEREVGPDIAAAVAEEMEYPRNAAIWSGGSFVSARSEGQPRSF